MLDPKFQLSAEDTAKFVAKFTDLPLVTKIEDLEIDEKLVEIIGDAIIRREGVFPVKKTGDQHGGGADGQPARLREARGVPAGHRADDRRGARRSRHADRAAAQEVFQGAAKGAAAGEGDVDIAEVAELIGTAYSADRAAR